MDQNIAPQLIRNICLIKKKQYRSFKRDIISQNRRAGCLARLLLSFLPFEPSSQHQHGRVANKAVTLTQVQKEIGTEGGGKRIEEMCILCSAAITGQSSQTKEDSFSSEGVGGSPLKKKNMSISLGRQSTSKKVQEFYMLVIN